MLLLFAAVTTDAAVAADKLKSRNRGREGRVSKKG
jgi:hypothetical protein